MDDDVLYLGTRLAVPEPLNDPCEPQLTGITLHVDPCGDKPAHQLSFHRARSSHVNIGRKSASDDKSMRRENDDHNAVFACQVVSAKHAKLVLADSGQAYIVDLHSRHGTHLLRRGEMAPRTLQAEVETLLADGDVLTFGKVVGAGSYHVSPVTACVELLTGRQPLEPSMDHPSMSTSPVTPLRKLGSGRYGLASTSCIDSDSVHSSSSISVSSDAASSPSDPESDVDEEYLCAPAFFRGKTPVKIPAFRSFIQDIYQNNAVHSPVDSDLPLEEVPGSPPVGPVRHTSPVVAIIEPYSKSRSHSPIEVAPSTPSISPLAEPEPSEPAVIGAWPPSRPESPRRLSLEMEVIRPEVPPVLKPEIVQPEPEPILPAQLTTTPNTTRVATLPNEALMELMHRLPPPPPFFPLGGPFSTSIASDFGLPSIPHPHPHPPPPPPPPPHPHRLPPFHPLHKVVTERVSCEIKGSLKTVEDRITALQESFDDLRARQSVTEDDMADLQSQVEVLEPDSEHLLCRISSAERNIASLSTLQGQMSTLQNHVTALRGRLDAPEPVKPVESPLQDVRACAEALNNLVSEMKLLREDVEKRIEAKMEAIHSARSEALDAMKEVLVEAETMRSLKRKREVSEETVEEDMTSDMIMPIVLGSPAVTDEHEVGTPGCEVTVPQVVPVVGISAPVPDACTTPPAPAPAPARPTKRARTAMYTVAHTAAVMAIGAAATWSALAFS